MAIDITTYPLTWPADWPRTSVKDQRTNSQWKKDLNVYKFEIVHELRALKATRSIISTNCKVVDRDGRLSPNDERTTRDPGVAVYFERPVVEDFKWMTTLMLTGSPTDSDIDVAFKRLALPHHPDRGGDAKLFALYSEAKQLGLAWYRRTTQPPNLVIACDTFNAVRLNLNAIALSLKAIRQLERCGTSQLLERTFQSMTTLIAEKAGA